MCGRFVRFISLDQFIKHFGFKPLDELPERYNIAPSERVPAIRKAPDGSRQLSLLRWGLVPSWAKEFTGGLINARGETINEKPSFRHAFRKQRCIIPASGFFEWRKIGSRKAPYFIHLANDDPMAFAGIWESWRSPEGTWIETCAIVTTEANALLATLHDRMPVILAKETFDTWLDLDEHEPEVLQRLLVPCPPETLTMHPISTMVNKVGNDTPECLKPIDEPERFARE